MRTWMQPLRVLFDLAGQDIYLEQLLVLLTDQWKPCLLQANGRKSRSTHQPRWVIILYGHHNIPEWKDNVMDTVGEVICFDHSLEGFGGFATQALHEHWFSCCPKNTLGCSGSMKSFWV